MVVEKETNNQGNTQIQFSKKTDLIFAICNLAFFFFGPIQLLQPSRGPKETNKQAKESNNKYINKQARKQTSRETNQY